MTERTYTLAAAQAELARQQCAATGHRPFLFQWQSMSALCECHSYLWTGQELKINPPASPDIE